MAATGWQAHLVRGAMSGAIKKGLGLAITSDKTEAGRIYRIQKRSRRSRPAQGHSLRDQSGALAGPTKVTHRWLA